MRHQRITCRLCGLRTRRLFTHVYYEHPREVPDGMDYADSITATMRAARGQNGR